MAVSHRGAISFGVVHIPVALYTATQDSDIHFNQLSKEDGSRVKYKKVSAASGKELTNGDIVKGYEYEPGKYVALSEDDFERAKTKQDKAIRILHFTDLQAIAPIYFEKAYHVLPDKGGDQAFALLQRAMREEQKVGVAKTVLGTKEKLLALIPSGDGLLAETMHFADEIKDAPKAVPKLEVDQAQLQMAKMLIGAMEQAFDPSQYHDEYRQKLWTVIRGKIKGEAIVTPPAEYELDVTDLMDALEQSLREAGAR